ncbi:hypothetical protein FAVG1_13086 [Fusarium avenaceum]|nr:hypothetical protein FAVG1_13086 [Fusarium avenaceum]
MAPSNSGSVLPCESLDHQFGGDLFPNELQHSTSGTCVNINGEPHSTGNSDLPDDRLKMSSFQFNLSLRQNPTPLYVQPTHAPIAAVTSTKSFRKKREKFSDSVWHQHKKTIKRLYMDDNHTLEETMAIMIETYQFNATMRMYKERLRGWGYRKNLKKTDVKNIVQKINERAGRETEVLMGGGKIEMGRVYRAAERYNDSEDNAKVSQCNAGVIVQTPKEDQDSSSSANHPKKPTTLSELSCFQLRSSIKSPLDASSLRADGRGLSETELATLKERAIKQISYGNREEGITSLIATLSGLQNYYLVTHTKVVDAAWSLVHGYTLQGVNERCDEVINWMSANYSKNLGLWHPLSLLHYIRVIEVLLSSCRVDEARQLGFDVYTAVRDGVAEDGVITIKQVQGDNEFTAQVPNMSDLETVFVDHRDDIVVGQQLKLAKLWSLSRLSGMETILRQLIQRFDSVSGVLQLHSQDARCILIEYLIAREDSSSVTAVCKAARDSQAKLIWLLGRSEFKELLRLSRKLSALHLMSGDCEGCTRILTWTADAFQAMFTAASPTGYNFDGIRGLLLFYVELGSSCYHEDGWNSAKLWIERAFGFAVRTLGAFDGLSLQIEQVLKAGNFENFNYDFYLG